MNNLYIDYEKGKVIGNKIKEESLELKRLLDEFNQIQEKLKNSISNIASETYSKPIMSQLKIMYKLADLTEETSDLLINISNAYIDVENSTKMEESYE